MSEPDGIDWPDPDDLKPPHQPDEWPLDAMAATDPPAVMWPYYRRPPTMLDGEAPHLNVYLAVHPTAGIGWAGCDRNLAHEHARIMGGVVARLPVVGDYREQPSDAGTVTA